MEIIAQYGSIFLIMACLFGFFMAWGIGANDVANAMGTSVGSGALTIKQAILIAMIFEFLGAYHLLFAHVLQTVIAVLGSCRCRLGLGKPVLVFVVLDVNEHLACGDYIALFAASLFRL